MSHQISLKQMQIPSDSTQMFLSSEFTNGQLVFAQKQKNREAATSEVVKLLQVPQRKWHKHWDFPDRSGRNGTLFCCGVPKKGCRICHRAGRLQKTPGQKVGVLFFPVHFQGLKAPCNVSGDRGWLHWEPTTTDPQTKGDLLGSLQEEMDRTFVRTYARGDV